MLVQHRQALNEQIMQLQEHRDRLDEKIDFYRNEIGQKIRCLVFICPMPYFVPVKINFFIQPVPMLLELHNLFI